MQERTAVIDGIRMRWLETGEAGGGPPAVLVHGLPTSAELWRHVLPKVQRVRCLAWEMVGYGGSIPEGAGRDISVRAQATYLRRWLDELELPAPVLVGHDLGGGVAQIAATDDADRCAGLVLTNAICYDSWPVPAVRAVRAMRAIVERLPAAALRMMFEGLVRMGHDNQAEASAAARLHFGHYGRHGGAAAFVRQVRSLDVHDTLAVAPALPSLGLPARVVWGAADRFQNIGYGERLARDLDAELVRIDGGKHFTPEDHPDALAAAIEVVAAAAAGAAREAGE